MLDRHRQITAQPGAHRHAPRIGRPLRPGSVRAAGRITALLLLVLTVRADDASVREQGLKALPQLLREAESADTDTRVRARRLARLIVLAHYRKKTPKGMRLIPGEPTITGGKASMKGGFYLSISEVTVAQFRRFLKATKQADRFMELDGTRPVHSVTLADARVFAKWRGARLPTHDELLHAASLKGRTAYPWGNVFEPHRVNSREGGVGMPLAPGLHPDGNTPDGLQDLIGNVAEWTSSRAKAGGTRYCVVGGSYLRNAKGIISAGRFVTYKLRATQTRRDVGFRLARTLPPLPTSR